VYHRLGFRPPVHEQQIGALNGPISRNLTPLFPHHERHLIQDVAKGLDLESVVVVALTSSWSRGDSAQ